MIIVEKNQKNFLIFIVGLVLLLAIALLVYRGIILRTPAVKTPTAIAFGTNQPTPTAIQRTSTPFVPSNTQTSPQITVTPSQEPVQVFYAAPDGSADGNGTKELPWSLQFVLNGPQQIQPGDTVFLVGGTYIGPFSAELDGAEGRPITIRAMPGERAILTSDELVLDIGETSYVNFWGLEIAPISNSRNSTTRSEGAYGVRVNQGKPSHDIKFINMLVHDMPAQGFGWWQANTNSEIYGSLIFFNGVNQFDHGLYVHNSEGEKRITDNIIFDNASHGIHAYGEKDYQEINNLTIEGNTVFNNGSIGFSTTRQTWSTFKRNILVGGYQVAQNPVILDNYTYYPNGTGISFNLGYRAGTKDAVVENNYFAGGRIEMGGVNSEIKMEKNTILGFGINLISDFSASLNDMVRARPSQPRIFVRPNQYEPGRANITVYNWSKQEKITLSAEDLKDVQITAGEQYELHNVQDYFDDVIQGTYDGQSIDVPMINHSVAQPMGLSFKPQTTFPEFGCFVLITQGH